MCTLRIDTPKEILDTPKEKLIIPKVTTVLTVKNRRINGVLNDMVDCIKELPQLHGTWTAGTVSGVRW